MPELVTHLSLAAVLGRVRGRWHETLLFLLGTALPDIVGRPLLLVPGVPALMNAPSHALVVQPVLAGVACLFFAQPRRDRVFALLLAGCLLHLVCDALQSHYGAWFTYHFLFPFSLRHSGGGFFHPSASICGAPWFLALALVCWLPRLGKASATP